jgi:hypothetical protein
MFDPRFKSLRVVENYVGCGAYICVFVKYGANAIILFRMIVFEILNLNVQTCAIEAIRFDVGSGDFIKG